MSNTLLNQPIIFVGAPCSGVSLVSNLLQFHPELCWLDTHFENHPHSDFHHRLFRLTSSFRDYLYTEDANLKQKIQGNLWGAVPAFCLSFWQEATRDDIDFYRGFLLGKYASHVERYLVNETLCRRLLLSGKSRFLLRFVGPSRLGLLKSMFPTAKFVRVKRDPAATVNSILNQERWEYEGKNMLWWRGAYSLEELSNYQRIRRDPIASTAFQLNKICSVTHEEMKNLISRCLN